MVIFTHLSHVRRPALSSYRPGTTPLMAFRFEKSLYDLIRGLRNHKGNENEYIQNCLKECRAEIRSQDMGQSTVAPSDRRPAKLISKMQTSRRGPYSSLSILKWLGTTCPGLPSMSSRLCLPRNTTRNESDILPLSRASAPTPTCPCWQQTS